MPLPLLPPLPLKFSLNSAVAPTLAVVAAFAESPTRVDGIGFIRDKESDRVAGPVTELRRAGVDAEEHDDGFVIRFQLTRICVGYREADG